MGVSPLPQAAHLVAILSEVGSWILCPRQRALSSEIRRLYLGRILTAHFDVSGRPEVVG